MNRFANNLKAGLLLTGLTLLVVFIGQALGGRSGMLIALAFAVAMNGFSYWFSDKVAIKMTGSRPVSREEMPYFYEIIERLTLRAGLPMPKLYLTPSQQPNAFATGRNPQHAAVAVTEGLIQALNKEELEGVLAHELAHIKNNDILISSIAATLAGVISTIANMAQWALLFGGLGGNNDDEEGVGGLAALPLIILGPIAAALVQMAISRSREYHADYTGAQFTGNPRGLANALLKLQQGAALIPMETSPATSHMFIVNPFTAQKLFTLFSTHPAIEDRVKRLLQNS